MSSISNAIFGRKHEPLSHHKTNPYHDHGYGSGIMDPYRDHSYEPPTTPQHYIPFQKEQSSILESMNRQIDYNETLDAHVFTVHLPGLKRGDVRVELDEDDKMLSIICEKSVEKQEQRGGWHLVETSSGHYVQRIMLPKNSNLDQVKGNMERGVLTLVVPKLTRVVNRNVRAINLSKSVEA